MIAGFSTLANPSSEPHHVPPGSDRGEAIGAVRIGGRGVRRPGRAFGQHFNGNARQSSAARVADQAAQRRRRLRGCACGHEQAPQHDSDELSEQASSILPRGERSTRALQWESADPTRRMRLAAITMMETRCREEGTDTASDVDDTATDADRDRLRPVLCAQLVHDVADVRLDRVFGDSTKAAHADVAVAITLGDQCQHLGLARVKTRLHRRARPGAGPLVSAGAWTPRAPCGSPPPAPRAACFSTHSRGRRRRAPAGSRHRLRRSSA